MFIHHNVKCMGHLSYSVHISDASFSVFLFKNRQADGIHILQTEYAKLWIEGITMPIFGNFTT